MAVGTAPQGARQGARVAGRNGAGLARRLAEALQGEARFDAFTRGRYATDASIYQIVPAGVVLPKSAADIAATLKVAAEHEVPVIMRGGGTSQNGQPIGSGLVVDCSRHFNGIRDYDAEAGTVTVEPGMVLERLNTRVKTDGWFFPVEPSTATRCTIGGMAGNNSCGARSLRFGKMSDNVLAMEALFHDAEPFGFGLTGNDSGGVTGSARTEDLARRMVALAESERAEILARYPKVQRRVGGYNLDALIEARPNLAHLLVGSEGTLAATTSVTLKLSRLPAHRVMGVCHFPSFRAAMETTRHIVDLDPVAVELVDNNVLVLGADIPLFRTTLADITRGTPNCLLLAEFSGENLADLKRDLEAARRLHGRSRPSRRGGRDPRAVAPEIGLGGARGLPQHHDVDEGRRQAGLVHRGLRGAARAPGRLHRRRHGRVHEARHAGHLVRPRLRRLPPRPPDPRHEAGRRRRQDARDRGGDLGAGAPVQGLLFRRARRRHLALGIHRAAVRPPADPRLRDREGRVRSREPPEPRQDRPSVADGRPHADAVFARLRGE